GIVALSFINLLARSAELTIALGVRDNTTKGRLFALEAWARIAAHGFEVLGLERIYARQAWPGLRKFNQKLELLGFQTEGVIQKGFSKGRTVTDGLIISCIYETYLMLKNVRGGSYWLGEKRMKKLIYELPERSWAEQVDGILRKESQEYFSRLKLV
ncbi:hypothetical protein KA005_78385, partial [bacterium]|nr:hypothetical protein [bacterium]